MLAPLSILVLVPLCVWVYLLLGRGFFWRLLLSRPAARPAEARVIAVVPARNEADVVARCVKSLLGQSGVDMRVILIDDASTDSTAGVARRAAADLAASERLTVLTGKPLPEGWTGKLWSVHLGVELAKASNPDFLLFTDADIEHGDQTVATLVSLAQRDSLELASYMVKLHCESFAERLLVPAFVYFFFKLYPPAWIADARTKTAGAAGGCMLVRPAALARAGGIEAIRGEIIDDCALARAIKRSGGRLWLGLTDDSRSLRRYGSFADIGRMISRTAFNQLRHSSLLLLGTLVGMLLTYLAPVVLVGWPTLAGFARVGLAVAWAMMTLSYVPMVRFYRLNPFWALTLPLAALFYMGATVWSALLYWSGRGGQWKGRAQDRSRAMSQ